MVFDIFSPKYPKNNKLNVPTDNCITITIPIPNSVVPGKFTTKLSIFTGNIPIQKYNMKYNIHKDLNVQLLLFFELLLMAFNQSKNLRYYVDH